MLQLPDHGTATSKLREFLQVGAQAQQPGLEDPPIRTPIINTYGP